jgi:phage/plasmid-associated DNA primase
LLKEYSDGKNIEVEIMYGTTEKIIIGSKLFFCSNPTPNFKTDGGIANRYKQLSFNSSFEPSNTYDDYETLQFKQNNNLQEELKDDLNYALISLLIDYAYQYTINKKLTFLKIS